MFDNRAKITYMEYWSEVDFRLLLNNNSKCLPIVYWREIYWITVANDLFPLLFNDVENNLRVIFVVP